MASHDNSVPIKRVRGKREMKELALATVTTLVDADLAETVDELQARVFSRGAACLFETIELGDNEWQWSFKPMVELLLLDLQDTAALPGLSGEERRDRISWAFEMAGF